MPWPSNLLIFPQISGLYCSLWSPWHRIWKRLIAICFFHKIIVKKFTISVSGLVSGSKHHYWHWWLRFRFFSHLLKWPCRTPEKLCQPSCQSFCQWGELTTPIVSTALHPLSWIFHMIFHMAQPLFSATFFCSSISPGPKNTSAKSRTGYVITVGDNPVVLISKVQTEIVVPTMEGQYIALSTALITLQQIHIALILALELNLDDHSNVSIVWEDNQTVKSLASNDPQQMTSRSKQIAIKYSHLFSNRIQIKYISTNLQKDDILTKLLACLNHVQVRLLLGMLSPSWGQVPRQTILWSNHPQENMTELNHKHKKQTIF